MKLPIAEWIFKKLATVSEQFDAEVVKRSNRPLDRFVDLVLGGREAVAFSFLKENIGQLRPVLFDADPVSGKSDELRRFWLIIGLIETGALEQALQEMGAFAPTDRRLFLGLHPCAYFMHRQRVTTPSERKLARNICSRLEEKIRDLRAQLVDELKSELLEMQKGKIKALEDKADAL